MSTQVGMPCVTIADSGSLDEDNTIGAITNPVGLATATSPDTGYGAAPRSALPWFLSGGIIPVGGGLTILYRQHRRNSRKLS